MVTMPAKVCRKIYSKLLGTTNPKIRTVRTCTNSPNLASKKVFNIKGKIHKGTTNTNSALYLTTMVVTKTISRILTTMKVILVLSLKVSDRYFLRNRKSMVRTMATKIVYPNST